MKLRPLVLPDAKADAQNSTWKLCVLRKTNVTVRSACVLPVSPMGVERSCGSVGLSIPVPVAVALTSLARHVR